MTATKVSTFILLEEDLLEACNLFRLAAPEFSISDLVSL